MCIYCLQKFQSRYAPSRRTFLKGAAATAASLGALKLFEPRPAFASDPPPGTGQPGTKYIIRGGSVMSMDPAVGDFEKADVLVHGKKIQRIARNINVDDAAVIDATGRIVMPGFIDTHHHQFETALRGFLTNGILINDGSGTPSADPTYYEYILLKFAPKYTPQDVYISELVGGLSQLDDGVTTVLDVSQIHHSPQHSDAAIRALRDTGRRAAFGYFESAGGVPGNQYPQDATRIKNQYFSSTDQLLTMIMGGEVYLGDATTEASWKLGRQLGLQIAAHILSPFGIRPIMDALAQGQGGDQHDIGIGPDNLFIHMTGMSNMAWKRVKDAGAQVSIAFPIEMNMRHGEPPILKMQSLGMEPSLSVDVEVTMTADFFAQMRGAMTMQRMLVNQMVLRQGDFTPPNQWPTPDPDLPPLLNVQDVLRFATLNGAKALRLDGKTGTLTPGKEADIIILDATRLNVMPLNHVPGAVVALMDRTNVETVIVAGKIRKWQGNLLDIHLNSLRSRLETSRDRIFAAAGVSKDLFK